MRLRRKKLVGWFLGALALVTALCSARPYAGSWNDGSRLATVESLVETHSWIIDDSTFVRVPLASNTNSPRPYLPSSVGLLRDGTMDKLFIDGHYYSDKSPVPALLMAGCYQMERWLTGWTARTHPDYFCRTMTWLSSGLAYVVAVCCVYRLGGRLRLRLSLRAILTFCFGFATVALPYCQHVNNHILLLAVSAALALCVTSLAETPPTKRIALQRSLFVGFLAGLAYVIDLGTGPVLFLCTAIFVFLRRACEDRASEKVEPIPLRCHWLALTVFLLGALPWLGLHHGLNFAIGGTLQPANANPEYFRWPGSPFQADNLTGGLAHKNVGSFLLYAASMMWGKRGFFGHNLPLFLTLPALIVLLRRHRETRQLVLWALGCCCGTWILYGATSNNSSGQCCTIRWFVPLLAPAFLILALYLKRYPQRQIDLILLSGWGMWLVCLMRDGPWLSHAVWGFWPMQGAALLSWYLLAAWRRKGKLENGLSWALPRLAPRARLIATDSRVSVRSFSVKYPKNLWSSNRESSVNALPSND